MSDLPGHIPKRKKNNELKKGVEVRKLGAPKNQSLKRDFSEITQPGMKGTVKNRTSDHSRSHLIERRSAPKMSSASVFAYGTLTCLIIALAIWFSIKRAQSSGGTTKSPPLLVLREDDNHTPSEITVSNGLALADIAAQTEVTLEGLLNAKTLEERIPWLRPTPGLRERMQNYYSREGVPTPDGTEVLSDISSSSFAEIPIRVMTTVNPETQQIFPWTLFPIGERMLVDWDSSVAYGEMQWEKFLQEKPEKPTQLRVFLKKENYYNFDFSDDKKYICYLVKDRSSSEYLFGYIERGSAIAAELTEVQHVEEFLPVNVTLRFPEGPRKRNQVHIEELIHLYWLDESVIRGLQQSAE